MLFYLTLTAIFLLSNACLIYQVDYEQIENIFENQINNLNISIMCLGYNLVYCYSLAQIKYNKIKNVVSTLTNTMINTLINSSKITILKKENIYTITTYDSGSKVNELILNLNDSLDIVSWKLENKDNFDLIIVSDKKDGSEQINYIHYTEFPQILDDYKHSTIKFFSVELEYKDTIHSIELTNENYNHYIVNNVLNKHFFKYYLINVLNIEIDKNTFDYKLSVIDHNVNIVELTQNDSLIIKENNYELIIDLTESDELFKETDELIKERSVSDDYVKFE